MAPHRDHRAGLGRALERSQPAAIGRPMGSGVLVEAIVSDGDEARCLQWI